LLRVVRSEGKGKAVVDYCTLTEKGLTALLEQSSPRPVLESLLKAIDGCQARIETWIAGVAESRKSLDGLREMASRVLNHLQTPDATLPAWAKNGASHDPRTRILECLNAWHAAGKIGDCPLPALFGEVKDAKTTLGQFHDALRQLHDEQKIYLHPWTGPLHELPQPAMSLLVGHEVAYYASLRTMAARSPLSGEPKSTAASVHGSCPRTWAAS
jgi:hypothetical protein